MKCEQCKYWRPEGHLGLCRRYPKHIMKSSSEWCGEFVAIEMLTLPVVQIPGVEVPEFPKVKRGRPAKENKNGE